VPRRESIEVAGFGHANPIPAASRKGPFVFSGAFTGRDPQTGEMPSGIDAQVRNVFRHVGALMAAAGGTPEDVVKMTVWLVDYRDREALNREWLAMFPDAASRPARHVVKADLDRDALIQADLVAVLDV
jgi:2-iminobutanoate/2-iminopropanoate deaminase